MRTPFKIIFLIFLPFCVFSQEKIFRSSIDHTDSINLSLVVDKGIRIELFPRIYSDFTIQNNELNNTFLVGKCQKPETKCLEYVEMKEDREDQNIFGWQLVKLRGHEYRQTSGWTLSRSKLL